MKKELSIAIITVSDKGYRGEREDRSGKYIQDYFKEKGWNIYRGEREDRSGKYIQDYFKEKGWNISEYVIVPDEVDMIKNKLIEICDTGVANLIITTGGTGFSPRDLTPEATEEIIERKVPGFSEIIRIEGQKKHPELSSPGE